MLRPIAILTCLSLGLGLTVFAFAEPASVSKADRFSPAGKPVPVLPASVVCEPGWTTVLTPRLVWMCAREMRVPK